MYHLHQMKSRVNRELLEPLRILTGQTASGKSSVAASLARETDAEIISVDSMKVYRGLDIGTAKPPYSLRERIPFHMIDIVDSQDAFTLARYLEAAESAAVEVARRGRPPLFAGGTPLYLRGLLYGVFDGPDADWELRESLMARAKTEGPDALHQELAAADPVTAARLHPNDLVRVVRALEVIRKTGRPMSEHQREFPAAGTRIRHRTVALRRTEDDLRSRIGKRTEAMFAAGLVAEVSGLLERGGLCRPAQRAIGYREVLAHVRGEMSLPEAKEQVKRNTWRMARKQMTFLRSFADVHWLDVGRSEPPEATAERVRKALFGPGNMN